jgi:hypothetical protein
VVDGSVGKVLINLSITSILSKPIVVTLKDVYILVHPESISKSRRDIQLRKEKLVLDKFADLNMAEEKKAAALVTDTPKKEEKVGFSQKLVAKIIINTQIVIKNVHIRYEDVKNPKNPIVVGVMFKELSINSTDKNWVPKLNTEPPIAYKSLQLHSLCIYHDNKVLPVGSDPELFKRNMLGLIPPVGFVDPTSPIPPPPAFAASSTVLTKSGGDEISRFKPHHDYLLEPAFLVAHVQLSLFDNNLISSSVEYVKNSLLTVDVYLSRLSLRVGSSHIPRIKKIVNQVVERSVPDEYLYKRPESVCRCENAKLFTIPTRDASSTTKPPPPHQAAAVTPPKFYCRCGCARVSKGNPEQTRRLWHWAMDCVMGDVKRRTYAYRWSSIKKRKTDREKYIDLWIDYITSHLDVSDKDKKKEWEKETSKLSKKTLSYLLEQEVKENKKYIEKPFIPPSVDEELKYKDPFVVVVKDLDLVQEIKKSPLHEIELTYPNSDIVFFRNLAEKKMVALEKKKKDLKEKREKAAKEAAKNKQGGFFKRLFQKKTEEEIKAEKEMKEKEEKEENLSWKSLSEADLVQFQDAVEYDQSLNSLTEKNPPEFILLRSSFNIGLISFVLLDIDRPRYSQQLKTSPAEEVFAPLMPLFSFSLVSLSGFLFFFCCFVFFFCFFFVYFWL